MKTITFNFIKILLLTLILSLPSTTSFAQQPLDEAEKFTWLFNQVGFGGDFNSDLQAITPYAFPVNMSVASGELLTIKFRDGPQNKTAGGLNNLRVTIYKIGSAGTNHLPDTSPVRVIDAQTGENGNEIQISIDDTSGPNMGCVSYNPALNQIASEPDNLSCLSWSSQISFYTDVTMPSGLYIANFHLKEIDGIQNDATTYDYSTFFVIKPNVAPSDHSEYITYQIADATWQSYNNFPPFVGQSLYASGEDCALPSRSCKPALSQVSYHRPFVTWTTVYDEKTGTETKSAFNNAYGEFLRTDYPLILHLSSTGKKVNYVTSRDIENGCLQSFCKAGVFLSAGHDEYVSAKQRASIDLAASEGTHVVYLSGNTMYWRSVRGTTEGSINNLPHEVLYSKKSSAMPISSWSSNDADEFEHTGLWSKSGDREDSTIGLATGHFGIFDGVINVPPPASSGRFWAIHESQLSDEVTPLDIANGFQLPGKGLAIEFDSPIANRQNSFMGARLSSTAVLSRAGALESEGYGTISHHAMSLYERKFGNNTSFLFNSGTMTLPLYLGYDECDSLVVILVDCAPSTVEQSVNLTQLNMSNASAVVRNAFDRMLNSFLGTTDNTTNIGIYNNEINSDVLGNEVYTSLLDVDVSEISGLNSNGEAILGHPISVPLIAFACPKSGCDELETDEDLGPVFAPRTSLIEWRLANTNDTNSRFKNWRPANFVSSERVGNIEDVSHWSARVTICPDVIDGDVVEIDYRSVDDLGRTTPDFNMKTVLLPLNNVTSAPVYSDESLLFNGTFECGYINDAVTVEFPGWTAINGATLQDPRTVSAHQDDGVQIAGLEKLQVLKASDSTGTYGGKLDIELAKGNYLLTASVIEDKGGANALDCIPGPSNDEDTCVPPLVIDPAESFVALEAYCSPDASTLLLGTASGATVLSQDTLDTFVTLELPPVTVRSRKSIPLHWNEFSLEFSVPESCSNKVIGIEFTAPEQSLSFKIDDIILKVTP